MAGGKMGMEYRWGEGAGIAIRGMVMPGIVGYDE